MNGNTQTFVVETTAWPRGYLFPSRRHPWPKNSASPARLRGNPSPCDYLQGGRFDQNQSPCYPARRKATKNSPCAVLREASVRRRKHPERRFCATWSNFIFRTCGGMQHAVSCTAVTARCWSRPSENRLAMRQVSSMDGTVDVTSSRSSKTCSGDRRLYAYGGLGLLTILREMLVFKSSWHGLARPIREYG